MGSGSGVAVGSSVEAMVGIGVASAVGSTEGSAVAAAVEAGLAVAGSVGSAVAAGAWVGARGSVVAAPLQASATRLPTRATNRKVIEIRTKFIVLTETGKFKANCPVSHPFIS